MKLTVDIDGQDVAQRGMLETAVRAKDLRPASRKIRDLLTDGLKRNFASQGSYFGGTWPPLSAATLARKRGGQIGVATGQMRTALEGGRGRSTSATKTQVKVGVGKKIYWARFFAGTKRQPPRQIVGATRGQILEANTILKRWITDGFA